MPQLWRTLTGSGMAASRGTVQRNCGATLHLVVATPSMFDQLLSPFATMLLSCSSTHFEVHDKVDCKHVILWLVTPDVQVMRHMSAAVNNLKPYTPILLFIQAKKWQSILGFGLCSWCSCVTTLVCSVNALASHHKCLACAADFLLQRLRSLTATWTSNSWWNTLY